MTAATTEKPKLKYPKRANGVIRDYCYSGRHENTQPRNFLDNPIPCCTDFTWCACSCHVEIDALFEMTGQERRALPNTLYEPPLPPDIDWQAIYEDSDKRKAVTAKMRYDDDGKRVGPALDEPPREKNKYDTEILTICQAWEVLGKPFDCTPKWVFEFAGVDKIDSVVTVHNVFTRWAKIGYANIEKKPVRFTGLTEAGSSRGYDACYSLWKRTR